METHLVSREIINVYKDGSKLVFKDNQGDEAFYDYKNNSSWINGKKKKNLKEFFKHMSPYKVFNAISDERYKEFFKFVSRLETRCRNVGTFIERMGEYHNNEMWSMLGISCGFVTDLSPKDLPKDVVRAVASFDVCIDRDLDNLLTRSSPYRCDNNYVRAYGLNSTKEVFLDTYYFNAVRYLHNNKDKFDYQFIKSVLWSIRSSYSNYYDLIIAHNYDYKSLIQNLYYYYTVEGLDVLSPLSTLEDEYMMQKEICRKPNKYPKNLLTTHQITTKNYQLINKKIDEQKFKENINKKLQWKKGSYNVVVPQTPKDLIDEGISLSHCVASYVDRIVKGICQIVFLRTNPQESLITVEIKEDKIVQARGAMNRDLLADELSVLKTYAKNKKLQVMI